MSHCCDIPKWKDVSSVNHDLVVQKSFIPCFASLDDVRGFKLKGVVRYKILNRYESCSGSAWKSSSAQKVVKKRRLMSNGKETECGPISVFPKCSQFWKMMYGG